MPTSLLPVLFHVPVLPVPAGGCGRLLLAGRQLLDGRLVGDACSRTWGWGDLSNHPRGLQPPPDSSPYPGWSPSLCLGHLPTQGCSAQTWSHVSPGWSPSPPQWPRWPSPTAGRPLLPLLLVLLDVLGPGGAEASQVGFDIPQLQVLVQGRLPPLRAAGMGTAESKAEPPLPPPRSQNKWLSPTPKLNPTTSPWGRGN